MKIHPLIFVLWFPLWFLILAIFNRILPAFHLYVVWAFWLGLLALVWLGRKQIAKALKNPEIYLVLFSLLLTFGAIEVALRFVDMPLIQVLKSLDQATNQDTWFFQDNHYSSYTVNSGNAEVSGDEINSFDYRGLDITMPKPDNVYRIVALGGSTTWGEGVEFWHEAYPHQLELRLREEYGYDDVEVINGGQPGYNSWETLMNFQFRALDLDPDMIIIYQNTNDVHTRLVSPELYGGDNSARRTSWNYDAQRLTENPVLRVPSLLFRLIIISTGLVELPTPDIDIYVSQPCSGHVATSSCLGMSPLEALNENPPIYYQRNLENIVAIAQQHNIDVVFMTWAYTTEFNDYASTDVYQLGFAQNNDVMRQVATELDVSLFDLAMVMPSDVIYWSDGRHMSVEGNILRAEFLAEFLHNQSLLPQ